MDGEIAKTLKLALTKIDGVKDPKQLEQVYIATFGKNGSFTKLTKQLVNQPISKRPNLGKRLNEVKNKIIRHLEEKKSKIRVLKTSYIDLSAPGEKTQIGHLHIISQAIEDIVEIFKQLGFYPASYPEIEWDYYAFESLNMPKDHPARDDWETFFVKSKAHPTLGKQVLTPHTSSGQIREMRRVKTPPVRMLNISRCYRRQIDVSHTPMFHQFEGLLIDKNVSIPNLKGTFDFFTTKFFGPQRITRLRPYHFRFTEPSFEVDVTCSVCLGKGCRLCKGGWLELGGAGMVHPTVLKAGGIDPDKYTGFAFGWGVERTIAMRNDVSDIRIMYQNDIRFLEQF